MPAFQSDQIAILEMRRTKLDVGKLAARIFEFLDVNQVAN
jgi:hypothetical protein